jgi:hypothetical protein
MGKIALPALAVALIVLASPDARPSQPAIGIGEVSIVEPTGDIDDGTLRAMVEEAVGSLDAVALPRGRAAVLSVSLVRLDAHADPLEVTCVVSATLRDRQRGAVFAVLQGSARGRDEPRRRRSLERAILRAAVGSAISRVPEAMRSRR